VFIDTSAAKPPAGFLLAKLQVKAEKSRRSKLLLHPVAEKTAAPNPSPVNEKNRMQAEHLRLLLQKSWLKMELILRKSTQQVKMVELPNKMLLLLLSAGISADAVQGWGGTRDQNF
jgi:hypothetical protein